MLPSFATSKIFLQFSTKIVAASVILISLLVLANYPAIAEPTVDRINHYSDLAQKDSSLNQPTKSIL